MTDRRVVITGIGVISPVGNDLKTTWSSLLAGKSGIGRITALDPSPYACQIGGEVKDFDPKDFYKNPKDARRTDRYGQLAVAAAKMAMEDSGVDLEKIDRYRFGCMVGSGIGGLEHPGEPAHRAPGARGRTRSRRSPFR